MLLHKLKYKLKKIVLMYCCLACTQYINAQQSVKDSLLLFKEFINISKQYQQPPFILNAIIKKDIKMGDFVIDSSKTTIKYTVKNNANAYVQNGEMEQLINDSIAVIIYHSLKRILVYTGIENQMSGSVLPNSFQGKTDSISKVYANSFWVSKKIISDSITEINLVGKKTLANTNISSDRISMIYNTITNHPIEVITTKNNLRKLSSIDSLMANHVSIQKNLVVINNNRYTIIESIDRFCFLEIKKPDQIELPFTINQRIVKNNEGEFVPIKEYSNYSISTKTLN